MRQRADRRSEQALAGVNALASSLRRAASHRGTFGAAEAASDGVQAELPRHTMAGRRLAARNDYEHDAKCDGNADKRCPVVGSLRPSLASSWWR